MSQRRLRNQRIAPGLAGRMPNAGIGPRLDFVEGRNRIATLRRFAG